MARMHELADLISAQRIGASAQSLLDVGAPERGQYAILPAWWWGFASVGRKDRSAGTRVTTPHRLEGPVLLAAGSLPVTSSTTAFGRDLTFTFEAATGSLGLAPKDALRFDSLGSTCAVATTTTHLPALVESGRVANWQMMLVAEDITRTAIVARLKTLVGTLSAIGQGAQFIDGAGFDDETITQIAAAMVFGDGGSALGPVGRFVAKAPDADFHAVEPSRWLTVEIGSLVRRDLARRLGDPRNGQMIRSAIAAGSDTSGWSPAALERATSLNLSPVMKTRALVEGVAR